MIIIKHLDMLSFVFIWGIPLQWDKTRVGLQKMQNHPEVISSF
jgi:hypothetical protein